MLTGRKYGDIPSPAAGMFGITLCIPKHILTITIYNYELIST